MSLITLIKVSHTAAAAHPPGFTRIDGGVTKLVLPLACPSIDAQTKN